MASDSDGQVIDSILSEIGFGRFFVMNYLFICSAIVFTTISGTTFIFTARDTEYRCQVPECEDTPNRFEQTWLHSAVPFEGGKPEQCRRYALYNTSAESQNTCNLEMFRNETEHCTSWVYGEGDSIVKGFNIPCEDWKRSLVGTVNAAGQLISLLFTGVVSDKYGRRSVLIIMTAATGAIGLAQSYTQTYWLFLVFEGLNLAAGAGAYCTAYVLGVEILWPSKRVVGSTVLNTFCIVGTFILGLIAWATPSWRELLRASNVPSISILIAFFALPESVRWLYVKGRRRECFDTFKRAASFNGVPLSQDTQKKLEKLEAEMCISINDDQNLNADTLEEFKRENSFMSMIKTPKLLVRLIVCAFCWLTNVLVYYGLSLNAVNIGSEKNVYLNFILSTLVEVPGLIFYLLILRYIGRRISLIVTLVGSGAACIVYAVTNITGTAGLLLYLVAKMCISTSFSLVYIYTSELFPTCLRNSSMNLCSVLGRIGGALAPQIPLLKSIHSSLPMLTYGIIPILSALTLLRLPETKDKNLPDTLKEAADLADVGC